MLEYMMWRLEIMKFLKKLIDSEYRELCRFEEIAKKIVALDSEYSKLSDEELKNKTEEFKKELEQGKTLDDIIVPAFATVREAAYRVIGEKPYFVQVVGGLAIHYGNIAEMKNSIPNLLNQIMYIIPVGVQLTSIQNTTEKHIVMQVQSTEYDQLGYLTSSLRLQNVLTNVLPSTPQMSNNIITIQIEGDLP